MARDTLHRSSLCPQLRAWGFLGGDLPLCLLSEGQAAAGWVGSPELPVPAHGHHHQQVPQDGHQYNGGDESEQHDLLCYAEALTRTAEHTEKKEKRKEKKRKAAAALGGDRPGSTEVPGTGTRFGECESSIPTPVAAAFPPRPLTKSVSHLWGKP